MPGVQVYHFQFLTEESAMNWTMAYKMRLKIMKLQYYPKEFGFSWDCYGKTLKDLIGFIFKKSLDNWMEN